MKKHIKYQVTLLVVILIWSVMSAANADLKSEHPGKKVNPNLEPTLPLPKQPKVEIHEKPQYYGCPLDRSEQITFFGNVGYRLDVRLEPDFSNTNNVSIYGELPPGVRFIEKGYNQYFVGTPQKPGQWVIKMVGKPRVTEWKAGPCKGRCIQLLFLTVEFYVEE